MNKSQRLATNQSASPSPRPSGPNDDMARLDDQEKLGSARTQPSVSKSCEGDLNLTRTKSIANTLSPLREFLFVGLLCSAQIVTQAGLVNALNILHIIGDDLGITNPGQLSWIVAGFSLTVGTFILIFGRCGDIFGFKTMMIIGYAWYAIWNIAAGCSVYVSGQGGQVLFIFSRVLGGIGPAILMPNAIGLLGVTYDPGRRKNMIFSLFGACAPAGAVLGGVFAGLWSLLWWPWTFWTFGIAAAMMGALATIILPSLPVRSELQNLSPRQWVTELDLLGASVGILAMILFNFAWNQAPGFGWQQPYIYVILIVGVLLFPIFFWIELKVAEKPLIPFSALEADVTFVLVCEMCGWGAFGIFIYYFIQILQRIRGASPLLAMAQFSPCVVMGAIAAVTTGRVISRIGPAWVMLISMLAFLVGSIITATMPADQLYWKQAFVTTLIIPWGMDMSFPAGNLIMSNAIDKKHQGMAASLVNTVINYSISIGVGIAGTVEVHIAKNPRTKEEEFTGYKAALYLAVGISGFGVLTSALFLAKSQARRKPKV